MIIKDGYKIKKTSTTLAQNIFLEITNFLRNVENLVKKLEI